MLDVRLVDPKLEPIRKAMLFFKREHDELSERLEKLKEKLGYFRALREFSKDKELVTALDEIELEGEILQLERDLARVKQRCDALPEPCSGCHGRGVAGNSFDTHSCTGCGGVGFYQPEGLRVKPRASE